MQKINISGALFEMFSAQVAVCATETRVEIPAADMDKIRKIFDDPMKEYFVNFTPNRRGDLIEVYCTQDEDDPARLAKIMRMGWTWRLKNGLASEYTHEEYERRFGKFVRRRMTSDQRIFVEGCTKRIRNRFKAKVPANLNLFHVQAANSAILEDESAYK